MFVPDLKKWKSTEEKPEVNNLSIFPASKKSVNISSFVLSQECSEPWGFGSILFLVNSMPLRSFHMTS